MKKHSRRGILVFLTIFIMSFFIIGCQAEDVTLEVYAGNGTKPQMEKIKTLYEEQNPNITIIYHFAASKSLEAAMRTLEQGDLYIAGDGDVEKMNKDGLLTEILPVASRITTVVVRDGDDIVQSWDDLAKEGVRITMPNPDLGSGGRAAAKAMSNSPLGEEIHANVVSFTSSIEVSTDMLLNNETDALVRPFFELTPGIVFIAVPKEFAEDFHLQIAVTTYTQAEEEAMAFAQFVSGPEGQKIFKETGYSVVE